MLACSERVVVLGGESVGSFEGIGGSEQAAEMDASELGSGNGMVKVGFL